MTATLLLLLLLLLQTVWCLGESLNSSTTTVAFIRADVCPPAWQNPSLSSASPLGGRACAVECAVNSSCSAFAHVGDTCRLAGRSDWQDVWVSGDLCAGVNAQLKEPKLSSELTNGLRLRYSFRYSLRCLVADVACPTAVLHGGATRHSSGVRLDDSRDSYVAIDVAGGLESLVGVQKQFTLFAKVVRNVTSNSDSYLVRSAFGSNIGTFWLSEKMTERRFWFRHCAVMNRYYKTDSGVAPAGDAMMSVAVTFDTQYHFYLDGVQKSVNRDTYIDCSSDVGNDVRLGVKHETSETSLVGRFLCFAVWTRALSAEELNEFADSC